MDTKIKNSVFVLLVLVLTLPAIQHKFRFFQENKLHGHFDEVEKPKLSWESWIKGDYQTNQEKYLNQVTGFRPGFVRLHHELDFDLFHIIHGNAVVEGKDDFLFEESYINSALGKDYLGADSIRYKTKLLKLLETKLNENGVHLLFVFAPGKGLIYSEKFPDYIKKEVNIKTNYQSFVSEFNKEGINFIDFQSYTKNNMEHAPYPLMCKTGIHWSQYLEYVAGDSIFAYLQQQWKLNLPRTKMKSIHTYNKAFGTDEDIEQSLNILRNLNDFPNMAYVHANFTRPKSADDPQVLVVGDSFYWGIFNRYRYHLNNPTFWYYFKEQYPAGTAPLNPQSLNLKEELLKREVVILLFTDSNLKNFGYGFIENALKALAK